MFRKNKGWSKFVFVGSYFLIIFARSASDEAISGMW